MDSKDIRIHKAIAEKNVEYVHQNSIHMAADNHGVEQNLLKIGEREGEGEGKKQLPELLKMADKSIKSTLHHGRKAETDEVENEIVDWILINRS